eukprot:204754_1
MLWIHKMARSTSSQLFQQALVVILGHLLCIMAEYFGTHNLDKTVMGSWLSLIVKLEIILWQTLLQSNWDGYSTYWVPSIANDIAIVSRRVGETFTETIVFSGIDLNTHKVLWSYSYDKINYNLYSQGGMFVDYTASTDSVNTFVVCADGVKSLDLINGVNNILQLYRLYWATNCYK